MDVGLEIRKISPRRFCLIFKRHFSFLSCVFFVLDVCKGEDSPGVATVACPREQAEGVLSELKSVLALVTEKAPQR